MTDIGDLVFMRVLHRISLMGLNGFHQSDRLVV
jgi:hypothetical protein